MNKIMTKILKAIYKCNLIVVKSEIYILFYSFIILNNVHYITLKELNFNSRYWQFNSIQFDSIISLLLFILVLNI